MLVSTLIFSCQIYNWVDDAQRMVDWTEAGQGHALRIAAEDRCTGAVSSTLDGGEFGDVQVLRCIVSSSSRFVDLVVYQNKMHLVNVYGVPQPFTVKVVEDRVIVVSDDGDEIMSVKLRENIANW